MCCAACFLLALVCWDSFVGSSFHCPLCQMHGLIRTPCKHTRGSRLPAARRVVTDGRLAHLHMRRPHQRVLTGARPHMPHPARLAMLRHVRLVNFLCGALRRGNHPQTLPSLAAPPSPPWNTPRQRRPPATSHALPAQRTPEATPSAA
jgi:hypothetical protein